MLTLALPIHVLGVAQVKSLDRDGGSMKPKQPENMVTVPPSRFLFEVMSVDFSEDRSAMRLDHIERKGCHVSLHHHPALSCLSVGLEEPLPPVLLAQEEAH